MSLLASRPFFSMQRQGHDEVVISGAAAVINADGERIANSHELDNLLLPMRSILKPLQATSAFKHLTPKDSNVLALSSHSGEILHLNILKEWASGSPAIANTLSCPAVFPLDPIEAERVRGATACKPQQIYHPCYGKHLAFALASNAIAADSNYCDLKHPLQLDLTEEINQQLGRPVEWAVDSCNMPTCIVSLTEMGRLWLMWRNSLSNQGQKILSAWKQNPDLIGGSRRLDSWITQHSSGKILAKEGADGLLIAAEIVAPFRTIVIKLASGYDARYLALALYKIIRECQINSNHPFESIASATFERAQQSLAPDQSISITGL